MARKLASSCSPPSEMPYLGLGFFLPVEKIGVGLSVFLRITSMEKREENGSGKGRTMKIGTLVKLDAIFRLAMTIVTTGHSITKSRKRAL